MPRTKGTPKVGSKPRRMNRECQRFWANTWRLPAGYAMYCYLHDDMTLHTRGDDSELVGSYTASTTLQQIIADVEQHLTDLQGA